MLLNHDFELLGKELFSTQKSHLQIVSYQNLTEDIFIVYCLYTKGVSALHVFFFVHGIEFGQGLSI